MGYLAEPLHVVEFPAPTPPWSINEERKMHWRWRSERSAAWRDATVVYARSHSTPKDMVPCLIRVFLPVPDRRKRDPFNFMPPVKALVDGLVDYGCWPDDDPTYVDVTTPRLVPPRSDSPPVVRVELWTRESPDPWGAGAGSRSLEGV